ncbi:MAG: glycosyltransferase family 2 protein [Bryobacteraceae bacterium]
MNKAVEPAISVVIPAYNAAEDLRVALEALTSSTSKPAEVILVDDGSTDETIAVARHFGVKILSTDGRRGPAVARNLGAKAARGDILFFLDADVCVHEDTVERVLAAFASDPSLEALIGSYDDAPSCRDFLSQYRNLMHCFVHQDGRRKASTFWSGCGAIRKQSFIEAGGFDASYERPAIEDIELGYRMSFTGRKMVLDPEVQVKHRKRWTFYTLVKTDVLDRGIPWTMLIMRAGRMPNDLNLKWAQRMSVVLVFLMLLTAMIATSYDHGFFLIPLLSLVLLVLGSYWMQGILESRSGLLRTGLFLFLCAFTAVAAHPQLGLVAVVAPVWVGFFLLFLRYKLTKDNEKWRRITGLAYGAYFALTASYLLIRLPRGGATLTFLSLLLVLIALNYRFYLFLFHRLGNLFGMAAIPFHVLYHFYNGVSFTIGALQYHLGHLGSSTNNPPSAGVPKKGK